jgi:hypothetical protein
MRLPNAESALVDMRKIREYCLSPHHPRGRHKARVFETVLGITDRDSEELEETLRQAILDNEAVPGVPDEFGKRYIVDFSMARNGKNATIRSCWIVLKNEQIPRFVSCFLL